MIFFQERRIHSCPPTALAPEVEEDSVTTTPTAPAESACPADVPVQKPRVIILSEALPEPALGSIELPTVGSVGHHTGVCKPCAFFHTRGCDNGSQCSFCHLCGPHEKRHRQKAKVAALREARRQEQVATSREVQR